MGILEQNIDKIRDLCYAHNVAHLFAFGSVLTDNFRPESDIDLIVDFSEVDLMDYADNYFNLKYSLENLLNRNVDLLEDKAIRNPFLRKSIDATKKQIYGS